MSRSRSVSIPFDRSSLDADLTVPENPQGVVLFAHGSGSGRNSPRNVFVAEALVREGFATVLLDLLTRTEAEEDERTYQWRFDIPLLSSRLVHAVDWLASDSGLRVLPVTLYGASTGGAAAMIAASERPTAVRSLVLRGARSDLADHLAPRIRSSVLFLVGELDAPIREANRATAALLRSPHRTVTIARATHLFEEPGALEAVARETVKWCRATLPALRPSVPSA